MEMGNNRMASRSSSTRKGETMINDEERRAVATRMRERTNKPMGKSMQRMFTETLGMYAHNICWRNPDKATNRWDVIVNYLADLIDRPTCRNLGLEEGTNGEGYDFFCSRCGFAADVVDPRYCPSCGAEVVE